LKFGPISEQTTLLREVREDIYRWKAILDRQVSKKLRISPNNGEESIKTP
jgi:hypothetical protein